MRTEETKKKLSRGVLTNNREDKLARCLTK